MHNEDTVTGLISCIIPVYNRQNLIIECVDSVLAQTYKHYEIIIVDDGSTDQTPAVLANLAARHPEKIRLLSQANQGPGAARQLGLNKARGEFVQLLDSDDLILPEKFATTIKHFNQPPYPDIIYSITHHYAKDNPQEKIIWKKDQHGVDTILPGFFCSRAWSTSTPIYKKKLLDAAGSILSLSCEEDLEFDCRLGLRHPKLCFIAEHHTDFRHHSGVRFSANNPNRAKQITDQIKARAGIYQSMQKFGLDADSEPMKHFARFLFLLSRQAGSLDLRSSAYAALDLAKISGTRLGKKDKLAMFLYGNTIRFLGIKTGSTVFNALYDRIHQLKK